MPVIDPDDHLRSAGGRQAHGLMRHGSDADCTVAPRIHLGRLRGL
ncbi:hypothetical protein M2316_003472 [Cellulosimicrobium cellulans]|nr:hypothetical protein [Cellulosimicrobium cellulans]